MHSRYARRGIHRRAQDAGTGARIGDREEAQELEDRGLSEPVTLTFTLTHPSPPPTAAPTDAPPPTMTPTDMPPPLQPSIAVGTPDLATSVDPIPSTMGDQTIESNSGLSTVESSSSLTTIPITTTSPPSPPVATSTSIPIPIPTSSTASTTGSGTADSANADGDTTSVRLSSGAIAGIAIGCLVVLIAALLFGLRKRKINNRMKFRGRFWARSKTLSLARNAEWVEPTPYTVQPTITRGGNLQTIQEERMSFVEAQPVTMVQANVRSPTSPRSVSTVESELPQPLPSAYRYGNATGKTGFGGMTSPSPFAPADGTQAIVIRSFVPSLPDELSISTGEGLEILQVFDDGWAECMNFSGDVGMVPLECFEKPNLGMGFGERNMAKSPVESTLSREDPGRNSRRYTSLPNGRR